MAYSKVLIIFLLQLLCISVFAKPRQEHIFRNYDTITVDGRERQYLLVLPPDYYTGKDFSLVIALHGGGGNAYQFESTSKLSEKAKTAGFIVVYPEGVKRNGAIAVRTWNAGACCEFARDNHIDDVKFISMLIDKLIATHKINPKKVYATGHSNGGMLTYRLACEIPQKIAAIAPNSCTMALPSCEPGNHPVAILHMHSALDTRVPYKGGYGSGIGTSGVRFPPVDSVLAAWAIKDGIKSGPKIVMDNAGYTLSQWTNSKGKIMISFYLTKDGGHGWPGGSKGGPFSDKPSKAINANDLLWDFFQQYQLP